MPTTSNFGWNTPADTDLVKDGALAIRTLGNNIDTSLVDLKGGTTGQVLSKASNSDLDYTWVTTDDANAIQNAIVDAKGDLIAASANDTPARLAVGNDGETLLADSATSTGLRWQPTFAAGKNKIINGDFGIWQRGTSFTNPQGVYTADRFSYNFNGTAAITLSRQTFTAGTAPVAGYESQYFLRVNQTTAGTGGSFNVLSQPIEDVRTFAGQTVIVSFWAKADASRNVTIQLRQGFGSGGSADVDVFSSPIALTTSWARYTATLSLASLSGKTIGTNSALYVFFSLGVNTLQTVDFWGIQVEAGSVATAFQTATGTLAGELAACQRYFYQINGNDGGGTQVALTTATYTGTTALKGFFPFPVKMRTAPSVTSSNSASYFAIGGGGGGNADTVGSIQYVGTTGCSINFTASASSTIGYSALVLTNNASAYVALSAEL